MDNAIVDDLAAEQAALDVLVDRIDAPVWDVATPAEGWTVRDQIAHLAFSDELAVASIRGDGDVRFCSIGQAGRSPGGRPRPARPERKWSGSEVLMWWRRVRAASVAAFRQVDASMRVPWGRGHMAAASLCTARLMETWAHSLDCFAALGLDPTDTDRVRHVCHLTYRAIPHAFREANLVMPGTLDDLIVELTSPSGDVWCYGSVTASQRIVGLASEFARVGVRRMKRTEATTLHADGPLAVAALGILKAYL